MSKTARILTSLVGALPAAAFLYMFFMGGVAASFAEMPTAMKVGAAGAGLAAIVLAVLPLLTAAGLFAGGVKSPKKAKAPKPARAKKAKKGQPVDDDPSEEIDPSEDFADDNLADDNLTDDDFAVDDSGSYDGDIDFGEDSEEFEQVR